MKIGLALSGGGLRAAAFHAGVLRRLSVARRFEDISAISTVSGGSLLIAALISRHQGRWPSSEEYESSVYPQLRELLTTADLLSFGAVGWSGLIRHNVDLVWHRARVLVHLLQNRWGVVGTLADLPDRPLWVINATCIETAKNWRFAKRQMGDWQFGRHFAPPYSIAEATASSAAVPYAIGALKLTLPSSGWFRTNPATREAVEPIEPASQSVRLWDGGAYENLGLEALYKPTGLRDCEFLICSDASAPLTRVNRTAGLYESLSGLIRGELRSPRLFDVSSDQIRSLRARMFINSIQSGSVSGVLLRMGNSVRALDVKSKKQRLEPEYAAFQDDQDTALASSHPTNLTALHPTAFDRLARHGFEVADTTLTTHASNEFAQSVPWANAVNARI